MGHEPGRQPGAGGDPVSAARATRRTSLWLAAGAMGLVSLFALQVAVDRLGGQLPGLRSMRNYLVHSEGA